MRYHRDCLIWIVITGLRHSPLFSHDFDRIKEMTRILQEAGLGPEELRNDLWVFRHQTQLGELLQVKLRISS